MEKEVKIVIIDDYSVFRAGIRLLLERYPRFQVIGEVATPEDLFQMLKEIRPGVIVMNLMLPIASVVSIAKKLHTHYSGIPLVILAVNASEYAILKCVIEGARGIIWKENSPEDLKKAIETVISGESFLDVPESQIVARALEHLHVSSNYLERNSGISPREMEVLSCIAKGFSYKEVADRLNISPRTVESHKSNILSKLNLNSTADLVRYALFHRLI